MIPFLNTVKGESLKTSRVGSDCKIYQCLCIIFPACFVYCVVKMVDHFLFFLFLSNKLERGLFWICFTLLPLERKIFREVTTFLSKSSCLEHILFTLQIWFWQVWQDSTNQSTVCFYWSIAVVSRNKRPFFFFLQKSVLNLCYYPVGTSLCMRSCMVIISILRVLSWKKILQSNAYKKLKEINFYIKIIYIGGRYRGESLHDLPI